MTQLDRRSPTTTTPSTPNTDGRGPKAGQPFNWRISIAMAVGLAVLFAVLFGLRALDIFPPRPAEDPEIAAVRATLAAIPTQQVAPVAQPTAAAPTSASAPAPLGPIVLSTPAPTTAPAAVATLSPTRTTAPAPAIAQPPATATEGPATPGAQFETAPTPVGTANTDQAEPNTEATPVGPAQGEATPAGDTSSSAQPTPSAINLPSALANAILQGYENYWTVRVKALNEPYDASIDLESVMAGTELETARQTIAHFRDTGQTGVSNVHHQIWITSASPDQAVVVDRYTAHGQRVMVDPTSQVPLPGDRVNENESYADRFLLQNIDGVWKVVAEEPE